MSWLATNNQKGGNVPARHEGKLIVARKSAEIDSLSVSELTDIAKREFGN